MATKDVLKILRFWLVWGGVEESEDALKCVGFRKFGKILRLETLNLRRRHFWETLSLAWHVS